MDYTKPKKLLVDLKIILPRQFFQTLNKIIKTGKEQWSYSKIIPVHKSGSKLMIENYRPVANLCSTSKIFERLILNRISQLELINDVDLSGRGQHGFKKGKCTATAGLLLQSMIARALDGGEFVAVASLDLSAAFDVVNVPLLIKCIVTRLLR